MQCDNLAGFMPVDKVLRKLTTKQNLICFFSPLSSNSQLDSLLKLPEQVGFWLLPKGTQAYFGKFACQGKERQLPRAPSLMLILPEWRDLKLLCQVRQRCWQPGSIFCSTVSLCVKSHSQSLFFCEVHITIMRTAIHK